MAIIRTTFFSEALLRYVNITAVIPVDKRSVDGETRREPDKPFKTLYLLHGIYGSEYDWITRSRVARWAQEQNLAVIMPAGENKFYCDVEGSYDYFGKYIGEDLVDFTRRLFRLSDKREDTYIAGLSMGGAGAILTGLRYPETFGYIGAFSSGLMLEHYPKDDNVVGLKDRRSYYETIVGPEGSFENSNNDYWSLARKVAGKKELMPKIYMACGLQDGLLPCNRSYHEFLESLNYDVTYQEENGNHEWDFWDRQLYRFLDFLPLEEKNIPEKEI